MKINIGGDYVANALRLLWSSGNVYRAIIKLGLDILPGVSIEQLIDISTGAKYLVPDKEGLLNLEDGELFEDCTIEEVTEILQIKLVKICKSLSIF